MLNVPLLKCVCQSGGLRWAGEENSSPLALPAVHLVWGIYSTPGLRRGHLGLDPDALDKIPDLGLERWFRA